MSSCLDSGYPRHPLGYPLSVLPHFKAVLYWKTHILLCAVFQPLPREAPPALAARSAKPRTCKAYPSTVRSSTCMYILTVPFGCRRQSRVSD